MIEKKIIKKTSLEGLFNKLKLDGRRIIAPKDKDGQIVFDEVSSFNEVAQNYIQTTLSAKSYVFPRYEEILSYQFKDKDIKIEDEINDPVPTVIFGIRPCDARGFASLNAVFTWDYQDAFFKSKLENTTIIAVSCINSDDYCFCTSVGGGPGDTYGSDMLLTPISDDTFLDEVVTEKGRKIVSLAPEFFTEATSDEKESRIAKVQIRFDVKELAEKLNSVFDSDIWLEQSLRCVGCGACAFVCPACVCFDIQDEVYGDRGKRFRCWDSCGFSLFTLHTSGHNPRNTQSQRWRQRIMHKFVYQPERLNILGCTGCGRCSRACPTDMNLLEHLQDMMETN